MRTLIATLFPLKKNAFYLIFLVKEVKRVLPADLFIGLNWQFSQKFWSDL